MAGTKNFIRITVSAVFLLALFLRSAVAVLVFRRFGIEVFWLKGFEVTQTAAAIISGHGYSSPFGVPTGPTAWTPPLYTFFVALVFRIFGAFTSASAHVLIYANVLCESISVGLMCYIGEKYLGKFVGIVSATLYAMWVDEMFFTLKMWDTSFTTVFWLIGIAYYFRLLHSEKRADWWIWGAMLGVVLLMSPQLLVVLVLLTLFAAGFRKDLRSAGISLLLALAILTPWTLRNFMVFHRFVPVRSNFGEELWLTNHDGVSGPNDTTMHPLGSPSEMNAYRTMGEAAFLKARGREAVRFIWKNPVEFVRMTGFRIKEYWFEPTRIWRWILLLGVAGTIILVWMDWKKSLPFVLSILIFPVPYYITHSESWYRHPIEPVMMLMCVFGVVRTLGLVRARILQGADPFNR